MNFKKLEYVIKVMELIQENYKKLKLKNGKFIHSDIHDYKGKVETVVMNPPFGVQREHADREFLEKALAIANVVYSFHKTESKKFLQKFSEDNNFAVTDVFDFEFPRATATFRARRVRPIRLMGECSKRC